MLWTRTGAAESLGLHVANQFRHRHMLGACEHAVGDQHLPGAGVGTQPGGQIGDAADGGVVEPALEADPAEGRKALGDTDSQGEVMAVAEPAGGKLAHGVPELERHPDRTLGRVVARDRVVEEHHDPVAR